MPNDKRSSEERRRRAAQDTAPQRVVGFLPPVQIAPAVFRRVRPGDDIRGQAVIVRVDARMTEGGSLHVTVERQTASRRVRVDIRTRSRYRWRPSGSFMSY